MKIVSVILFGDAGTRLWPASRQAFSKSFMTLGGSTLLEQAISQGHACGTDKLVIVTNQDHLFLTKSLLANMQNPQSDYLLGHKGSNTAPAIALTALTCREKHGDAAIMLVLPADHLIPDTESFVENALEAARPVDLHQHLVVFGIYPTKSATGFGYVEVTKLRRATQLVLKFAEMPDIATAEEYLLAGRCFWNSGMFNFTAGAFLKTKKERAPDVLNAATQTLTTGKSEHLPPSGNANSALVANFDSRIFGNQPDISIDYAVMEKDQDVVLVSERFGWSDVGKWPCVANAFTPEAATNTMGTSEHTAWIAVGITDTHAHIESPVHKVVATMGLKNLVTVDNPDTLLIASKQEAHHWKKLADMLKQRNIVTSSASIHPITCHHSAPLGRLRHFQRRNRLQSQPHVSEFGPKLQPSIEPQASRALGRGARAKSVHIGDTELPTQPREYRHIPAMERHLVTNIGSEELISTEVQCGGHLGEDKIVRLANVYGRAPSRA